jgi:sec-independent protein translocase protein TatA
MPNVGPMELIVVLAIALIVLGPKRLPEVGKSLGKGLREFKDSIAGDNDDDDDHVAIEPAPEPVAAVAPEATPPVAATPPEPAPTPTPPAPPSA